MKTTELKKLKLNVTNIKSSLFSYGKQSKKIRSDRKSLFSKEESENKKNEKENKIESPLEKIKSIGSNIKQSLIAGPMSILDKIKEFLTIIVFGLLVNNLPKIIAGLQKFFGNNPWILKTIEWTIKTIGKGILGFIDLVNNFSKFAGGTYATIAKTTQDIKKQIDGLGNLYNNSEKEIKDLITKWTSFFNPKPTAKPSAKSAQAYAKSKGKYYSNTTGKTYANYATALKNPQVRQGAQQQAAPPPVPPVPVPPAPKQKLASGGTVSSSRSNAAGTSARPETRTLTVATSPFARPGGTAKGRKAIQSVNYFGAFNKNTKNSERNTKMSEENTSKFEDITERLKAVNKLKAKVKDDDKGRPGDLPPGRRGEGGGGGFEGAATVLEGSGENMVWNFFKGKGLSDIATAGIMGNAEQESRFDPKARGKGMGPGNSDAIGLFQWGETARYAQLVDWSKKKKLNPETLEAQLQYSWYEANLPYYARQGLITGLQKAKTPSEAAEVWRSIFEASEGTGPDMKSRQVFAEVQYKKHKGKLPTAITDLSQKRLPALPPTNTLSGQYYGAPRDDNDDGIPDRKHAGVDFDISGNDKFYSRLGGEVIRVGSGYGDDGDFVDIYNPRIKMTERIAEARKILVKQGQTVIPGQAVAQGESETGVIHYEIRTGKAGPGGDYAGTVNPIKFLNSLGAQTNTQPVAKQNLSPLTSIIQTMQDLKQNTLQLGDYTLTLDGDKLKVDKKSPLGFLDFLGLFSQNKNINDAKSLNLLKKLKNDILYYQDKQPPENYRNYGGNASIKPIGKTGDMVASLLNTKDPNDNTNYVLMNLHHTTVVKDTQTIAMKVPVYVQESGSSDSTSSISSEVRSLLG